MDNARARRHLEAHNYQALFLEELGWDQNQGRPFSLEVKGQAYTLHRAAKKREFQVLRLEGIPEHKIRVLLERQLNRMAAERLVIFEDRATGRQLWEWVLNERGKPLKLRTAEFRAGKNNELFLQKLKQLAFTLAEEESATTFVAGRRVRRAFDVERVTRRFYEQFQREHQAFFARVSGLPEEARRWYTSLMLNRLMFVYFVQKKGFLDGNPNYLRDRLHKVQTLRGKGRFHSFYRDFLLVLFHDGLGSQKRPTDPELRALLGTIPYLNGGLFEIHPLEAEHAQIQIPDEAFEQVFAFFEQYQWHLDDRPLREGNEINPDVLGYIFEKYINQKQMGAYYTKEDITEYIAKNTILPHILETTRQGCRVAFEGQGSLWKLLQQDPDRYLYEAVRRGADYPEEQLPEFVQKGMHDPEARMFDKRYNLGQADLKDGEGNPLTLPTETWREYITRRQRYHDLKARLSAGEVQNVADLITLNLNLRQFAQDVLDSAEGADLVRAYWKALSEIRVLDPTCGSGAFLFAALNILQPLYESALDKMEALVSEADAAGSTQKYPDFRRTLAEVSKHPSERYYVLKSIVVNNLYGVDIMEEATEIAKLRLFLKLMSQIEHPGQLEPLPDIDFNIRAGNALVGFATLKEISDSFSGRLDYGDFEREITEKLDDLEALSRQFRLQQTEHGGAVTPADKQTLRQRLHALEEELNRHLAAQYGIDPQKPADYQKWKASHKPFHWFVDFYGIMKNGGFDAIIGNPPYIEMSKVSSYNIKGYVTELCGNIYAPCVERFIALVKETGGVSVIVPLSGFSTERMQSYQDMVAGNLSPLHISYFSGDAHPSVLFNGVKYRLCIIVGRKQKVLEPEIKVTDYQRWYAVARATLFPTMVYSDSGLLSGHMRFSKLGTPLASSVLRRMLSKTRTLGYYLRNGGIARINYHRSPVFWIRAMNFEPYFSSATRTKSLDHLKDLFFSTVRQSSIAGAMLNSTCFYFWFTGQGNCRNIAGADIETFPVGELDSETLSELIEVYGNLMDDYRANSKNRIYTYEASGRVEYQEFYPVYSKPIIDQIDRVLARHYGFTPEELDFIINYDIKYRMGRDALEGEEG